MEKVDEKVVGWRKWDRFGGRLNEKKGGKGRKGKEGDES